MKITIQIPYKVSTNAIYSGMHWAKRKEIADEYHLSLIEYKGKQMTIPVNLTFTFTFKGKSLDCSNCSFMAKMLEDAMVMSRILPNDTPEYVKSIKIVVLKGIKDMVSISD